ncbi:MAG: hypothetical protein OJF48_002432 [Afipia sp.]|jgi:hypothetical protein|nr:MAG: hypothetical protein OJF48_002432 [Afipia sp.]
MWRGHGRVRITTRPREYDPGNLLFRKNKIATSDQYFTMNFSSKMDASRAAS